MGQRIPENYMSVAIPIDFLGTHYGLVTIGVHDVSGTLTPIETVDATVETFADNIGNRIDSACTIGTGIGTVEIDPEVYATVPGTYSTTGLRSGGDSTPPAVSVLVRKVTDRPGRPGRGRMFIPWALDEADVDERGTIDGGTVTALQVLVDAWGLAMTVAGLTLVLLHDYTAPGGNAPTILSAAIVDPQVATQRRRQRR